MENQNKRYELTTSDAYCVLNRIALDLFVNISVRVFENI